MTDVSREGEQSEVALPKKTVLVVEDDLANAEMLHLLLQSEGLYNTHCFLSADAILSELDDLSSLNPALFLLDYRLPPITGLDLSDRLHATKGLEQVPTLLLTALSLSETEEVMLKQQGLCLVSKPYDAEELLDLIRQMTGGGSCVAREGHRTENTFFESV